MNINELGEFGLIERIKQLFGDIVPEQCESIGDDCAVLPMNEHESLVVTTDMLLEGVHFLSEHISPRELGAKSLAVNLSDVAAMGARPFCTFLSIALPEGCTTEWIDAFMEGYRSYGVPLLGGDTTRSHSGLVINITALGIAPKQNLKYRHSAESGDRIMVTGNLGDSGAGLRALIEGKMSYTELIRAHHNPRPAIEEGMFLGSWAAVGAMMDISDGIASDLRHILRASGELGATINIESLPMSRALRQALTYEPQWNAVKLMLTAGEDYHLLLTVRPAQAEALRAEFEARFGYELHDIGQIDPQPGIRLATHGHIIDNGAEQHLCGFRHF